MLPVKMAAEAGFVLSCGCTSLALGTCRPDQDVSWDGSRGPPRLRTPRQLRVANLAFLEGCFWAL